MTTAKPTVDKPARKKKATPAAAPEKVLVLRTCDAERKSGHSYVRGGFQWPESGPVEALDWKPAKECGKGLHGWLWGEGEGDLGNWAEDAVWLVLEVLAADIIDLGGKVKFPRAEVVFAGTRPEAIAYLVERAPAGKAIIGHTATAGDGGTATAGYRGTATAGDRGTATAGDGGTATAGDRGTATAGDGGTATAGYGGSISIEMRDEALKKYRKRVAEVGGPDGLKPGVLYRLVDGKFCEVQP